MNVEDSSYEVISSSQRGSITMAKTFIAHVFSWMFFALTVTAVTSFLFASSPSLLGMLRTPTGMTFLGWVVLLAPLGFVLLMSAGFRKLSAPVMTLLFIAFSVLLGMSLSFIFIAYTMSSIFLTFAITAGMFGTMAIAGYTTQIDLTRFGSLMMMGLVGLIIATVVNMFMKSDSMQYIISFIGVIVFTGLTGYDVQKLKRIGSGVDYGTDATRKLTIMGALTLYLDFINLFLFLLRFFGNRR
ncbi:MAG: Bax inhibitor-1/YccA family protein [Bacteroidetes bacterium]|nr:Bax inhibitor-1/YccA family protein [Bacteroidota bacterium]